MTAGDRRPVNIERPSPRWLFGTVDLVVTLLLWLYFTLGFVFLIGPFYLWGVLFKRGRHSYFQMLNHLFYRGFFWLCRMMAPRHTWRIDPAIRAVRGAVIVCNHVSFIDSILLISLFARHNTIVKNRFFHFPILGWVLTLSGYLPAAAAGRTADLMLSRLDGVPAHLNGGGILFVFPEGTRSRNGRVGVFNSGAFKIAKYCRAPVVVLVVRNSEKLFPPGRFLFNTCMTNTIHLELAARIVPDYDSDGFSLNGLMNEVRDIMVRRLQNGAVVQ